MQKALINTHLIACALIVLLTVGLYGNALRGDFIWDDRGLIINDTHYLNDWKNIFAVFVKPFFGDAPYYRPLLTVSFIVDYQLWGTNPFGFHCTNVLLHTINALLVYFLALLIFKQENIALFTGLLFTAHPVQTEAVAWISGRNDVLLTFFALISIILHLGWHRLRGNRKTAAYLGYLVCYACVLLTKESGIILPLLFILMDCFFRDCERKPGINYGGLLLVSVLYYFVKVGVIGQTGFVLITGNVFHTLSNVFVTYGYYLKMLLFPLFQSAVPSVQGSDSLALVISSWCLVFCLSTLAVLYLKKCKAISFIFLWVLVSLLPVCGIVPLSIPALEHRLYLGTVCFSMLIPLIVHRIRFLKIETKRFKAIQTRMLLIIPLFLLLYSAKTVGRNRVWHNELTFWRQAVHDAPHSALARNNLGIAYARKGDHEMAIDMFKTVEALYGREAVMAVECDKRGFAKVYNNLGRSYHQLLKSRLSASAIKAMAEESDKAQAAYYEEVENLFTMSYSYYHRSLWAAPGNAEVHNNLGDLFYLMNDYHDAEEEYIKALKHNPDNAQYYNNLGLVYYALKKYDGAEDKFSRAISLQHDLLEARNNLALVYLHQGMYQKALEQLEMVLSYGQDDNGGVYYNLALVYLRGFHDSERAAYYLNESLRLKRHNSKDQMVRDSSCGRSENGVIDRHS